MLVLLFSVLRSCCLVDIQYRILNEKIEKIRLDWPRANLTTFFYFLSDTQTVCLGICASRSTFNSICCLLSIYNVQSNTVCQ